MTKRRGLALLLAVLLVLVASAPVWLPLPGTLLIVDDPPRPADAIVGNYRGLRTRLTMRGAFRGQPVDLMVRSVATPRLDLAHWWTNRDGVNVLMNEWPRLIYYGARGRY